MSQPNQHRNSTTMAAKERTTQALAQTASKQDVIKSSSSMHKMLKEQQFRSQNRRAELETVIQAMRDELADEMAVLASVEAGLVVLEEYPQKQGAL